MKSIALIGLSGSGKSTVARLLAQRLGWPCADTDPLVEELAGIPIPHIFRHQGEAAFRELEAHVLHNALVGEPIVLATGGGIVLRATNRQLLRTQARSVWLDSPVAALAERLARHSEERPLLQGDDPLVRLEELRQQRAELYRQTAVFRLDTSIFPPSEVAARIAAWAGR